MEKDEIKNSDNTGEDIEKSSVDKDLVMIMRKTQSLTLQKKP